MFLRFWTSTMVVYAQKYLWRLEAIAMAMAMANVSFHPLLERSPQSVLIA